MKKLKITLLILFIGMPILLFSQDLVYKPINPFFGGDTFNYQQLLASANAQNDFEESSDFSFDQGTDLENFTETLNKQLLSALSQDLFQEQIGDTELGVGTYVYGSLVVDISPSNNGLVVNILDTSSGEQTQIIIPN